MNNGTIFFYEATDQRPSCWSGVGRITFIPPRNPTNSRPGESRCQDLRCQADSQHHRERHRRYLEASSHITQRESKRHRLRDHLRRRESQGSTPTRQPQHRRDLQPRRERQVSLARLQPEIRRV